ncbi:MAG: hypothetical protein AAB244_03100 [Nitrospirota bacterium]
MDDKTYEIKYYKHTNFNGLTIYSSEVDFGKNDKVILDDNSIYSLENKLRHVVPAAILTRKMIIETTETIKTILLIADNEKEIRVLSGQTT